jgi:hypothetical protein
LSFAHEHSLKVSNNGYCSHLKKRRIVTRAFANSKRGVIKGLSRQAASRCKRVLLSVDRSKVDTTFEGCNTVPAGEFTFADFRLFMKNWRDRFQRRFPGVACAWVKELTGLGTPHLHFILIFPVGVAVPSLRQFRAWNDVAWSEVVKSSHPSHQKSGCRVDLVRSWERVVRYLSSYLTEGSEGRDRQSDTGKMWGVIGRKFLPSSFTTFDLEPPEYTRISRALVRYRQSQITWLRSSGTHSSRKKRGRPVKRWRRLSADPAFKSRKDGPAVAPASFEGQMLIQDLKQDGYRLRRIKSRPFRREITQNVWCSVEGTAKVERSLAAKPVWVSRVSKLTGERERVQVDEVNSVPMAWHYLPSSEVLRLLAFVRRDPLAGLTSAERRWLLPPGQSAIMRST